MVEAWFSIVGQELSGTRFLDAFSGSGRMAFEAWSRGAQVTAVELRRPVAKRIEAHQQVLRSDVTVRVGDLKRVLPSLGEFDLVYADPPYDHPPDRWLEMLVGACTGAVWFEAARSTTMPPTVGTAVLKRSKRFGDATLHAYECR